MKFNVLSIAILATIWLLACQQSAPKAPETKQDPPAANTEGLSWAGDTDPVCDMKVDQTTEDTAHYGGKIYGFCGPNCKDDFKEDPAKYVGN